MYAENKLLKGFYSIYRSIMQSSQEIDTIELDYLEACLMETNSKFLSDLNFIQSKVEETIKVSNIIVKYRYLIVALYDQIITQKVLNRLGGNAEYEKIWNNVCLEPKLFGTAMAGQKIFEDAAKLIETANTELELTLCRIYYLIITIGFNKLTHSSFDNIIQNLFRKIYKDTPKSQEFAPKPIIESFRLGASLNQVAIFILILLYLSCSTFIWMNTTKLAHDKAIHLISEYKL